MRALPVVIVLALVAACSSAPAIKTAAGAPDARTASTRATSTLTGAAQTPTTGDRPFALREVARYDEPWAMAFLPDGRALITLRTGRLVLRDLGAGTDATVAGTPEVVAAGQGGLGDVIVAPTFASDSTIYLSWVEAGEGGTLGAAVGRATLDPTTASPRLNDLQVIWRQQPKVTGAGHFGHRLAVSPDGRYLFVSSGERQKFDPAQDLTGNLGKIVRLNLDGTPASGNPFADRGGVASEIWSYGHRNPLGLAFDASGNLWESEMGPQGGDEVNLILPGRNYGWPRASNGSHYGGADIPDHASGDGFEAPLVWWNPSISPGSLLIVRGPRFPGWQGDALVGALSGQALIRVDLDGTSARLAERWDLGTRVRALAEAPDGSLWLLEDGPGARLLEVVPA